MEHPRILYGLSLSAPRFSAYNNEWSCKYNAKKSGAADILELGLRAEWKLLIP